MNKKVQKDKPVKLRSADSLKWRTLIKRVFPAILLAIAFSIAMAFITKLISIDAGGSAADVVSKRSLLQIFSLASIISVLFALVLFYVSYRDGEGTPQRKLFAIIFASFALTYVVCAILGRFVSLYVMPLSLGGLFIAMLINRRQGIVANVFFCVGFFATFVVLFGEDTLMAALIALITGIVSGTVLILRMEKTYTRLNFVGSAAVIALIMAPIAFLTSFIPEGVNLRDSIYTVVWTVISVLLSVTLFIPGLAVFEKAFRSSSNFGLEEICSFNAPLLKRLSTEAPGTFNHSLAVGNLAQLCAIAIGENPQLAKAGAYYHDVGKLKDPLCYVENQKDYNPHDDFIPEVSVYMITQHTNWGYEMIKQANLPDEVANIAKEHHGTTPVNYFYYKVQNITEGDVGKEEFCYEGPVPSSRIAAIIMIADTVEAAIRAIGIGDEETLRKNIHKLIDEKMRIGQFDNCNITLKQIKKIEDTLVESLPSIYHHRIEYKKK